MQIAAVWGPPVHDGQSAYWAVRPSFGLQLNSPF